MSKWLCLLSIVGGMLVGTAQSSLAGGDCGCDGHAKACRHHCCCCCCDGQRSPPRSAPPMAPRAAIVESLPVFQMTPGVVAMPMMMAGYPRAAPFEDQRSRSEPACAASKDRLETLETKVEALDLRMRTIQRSVEIQVRILEEMKAEGRFPKRYLPSESAPKQ